MKTLSQIMVLKPIEISEIENISNHLNLFFDNYFYLALSCFFFSIFVLLVLRPPKHKVRSGKELPKFKMNIIMFIMYIPIPISIIFMFGRLMTLDFTINISNKILYPFALLFLIILIDLLIKDNKITKYKHENDLIFNQKKNSEKEYYYYLNPDKMAVFLEGLKDNDKIIEEFSQIFKSTDKGKKNLVKVLNILYENCEQNKTKSIFGYLFNNRKFFKIKAEYPIIYLLMVFIKQNVLFEGTKDKRIFNNIYYGINLLVPKGIDFARFQNFARN